MVNTLTRWLLGHWSDRAIVRSHRGRRAKDTSGKGIAFRVQIFDDLWKQFAIFFSSSFAKLDCWTCSYDQRKDLREESNKKKKNKKKSVINSSGITNANATSKLCEQVVMKTVSFLLGVMFIVCLCLLCICALWMVLVAISRKVTWMLITLYSHIVITPVCVTVSVILARVRVPSNECGAYSNTKYSLYFFCLVSTLNV